MDLDTIARAISELTTDEQMRLAHLLRRHEAGATLVPRSCAVGLGLFNYGQRWWRPHLYDPHDTSAFTLPHEDT